MRRREVIALISGAATWPLVAGAQQAPGLPRIGLLWALAPPSRVVDAFRSALADLGYVDGRTAILESRFSGDRYDRLPAIAAELVRLDVDVLVAAPAPAVIAAKAASRSIPIVMIGVADPVGQGLVASLARPGGNVTGLTNFVPELAAKRLELLKETMPNLTDIGVLLNAINPANEPILPAIRRTAEPLKLKLHQFGARESAEFEAAFVEMAAKRVGALAMIEDATLLANAPALAQIALQHRLPSSGWPDYAVAGGLLSYGINFPDMFRRAATFVDKILKGTKPTDLPVERAMKFETIVNLKTARAVGELPTSILMRADEVIE